ncbi:MAG: class I SAM-dependent methyltransferase [Hyphomicrobiales bacterium]|nr:class I SAM-dependent methyltransferase [Hyphomicrobiales bacterium]
MRRRAIHDACSSLISPAPYKSTIAKSVPIDAGHASLLRAEKVTHAPISNVAISGVLWPEDAAKLYELAYFCRDDILELGTKFGLSTVILAEANRAGGYASTVYTVDIVPKYTAAAKRNAESAGIANVVAETSDAAAWLDNGISANRRFGLAFVDHAHDYENVKAIAERLDTLLLPGSYVIFHDFLDRRNDDPADTDYGVWQGAADGLADDFTFIGIYGCAGLFARS